MSKLLLLLTFFSVSSFGNSIEFYAQVSSNDFTIITSEEGCFVKPKSFEIYNEHVLLPLPLHAVLRAPYGIELTDSQCYQFLAGRSSISGVIYSVDPDYKRIFLE